MPRLLVFNDCPGSEVAELRVIEYNNKSNLVHSNIKENITDQEAGTVKLGKYSRSRAGSAKLVRKSLHFIIIVTITNERYYRDVLFGGTSRSCDKNKDEHTIDARNINYLYKIKWQDMSV